MKNKKRTFIPLLIFVFLLTFVGGDFMKVSKTFAQTTEDSSITGYAWSSNIGWIQFDPAFGGVKVNATTGNLSGYAWSSNIGWISFNAGDVSACPGGIGCTPNFNKATRKFSGFAKAINSAEGWDGFIRLGDTALGYGLQAGSTGIQTSGASGPIGVTRLVRNENNSNTTLTLSNVNTRSTPNDALVVSIQAKSEPCTVASVTFGTTPLIKAGATKAVNGGTTACSEIWYLMNPEGQRNVIVTFTQNQQSKSAQALKITNVVKYSKSAGNSWNNVSNGSQQPDAFSVEPSGVTISSIAYTNGNINKECVGCNEDSFGYNSANNGVSFGVGPNFLEGTTAYWRVTNNRSADIAVSQQASFKNQQYIKYPITGVMWGSDIIGWVESYNLELVEPSSDTLAVSCSPDKTTANTGETVTWSAFASGGNGTYTYLWTDTTTNQTNPKVYDTGGTFSNSVTVTSGGASVTQSCGDVVVSQAICEFDGNTYNAGTVVPFYKMNGSDCEQSYRTCLPDGTFDGDPSYDQLGFCPNNAPDLTTITFRSSPKIIDMGDSCDLYTTVPSDSANFVQCSISGGALSNYPVNINNQGVGSKVSDPNIQTETKYTLTCTPVDGEGNPTGLPTIRYASCTINPEYRETN